LPNETDSILLVDPNTVLASAVTRKRLKPVARRNPQVFELLGGVDLIEFPAGYAPQLNRTALSGFLSSPTVEYVLRAFILE